MHIFCLAGYKDIGLVWVAATRTSTSRVIFFCFHPVIRKGTKGTCIWYRNGWQCNGVRLLLEHSWRHHCCRCCCFNSAFSLSDPELFLEDLPPCEGLLWSLRSFQSCCDCFQEHLVHDKLQRNSIPEIHCQDWRVLIRSLLLWQSWRDQFQEVLPTWVPPQSSTRVIAIVTTRTSLPYFSPRGHGSHFF